MWPLSLFGSPTPKTIEQIDKICSDLSSKGSYRQAVREAQKFRDYIAKSSSLSEEEKYNNAAVAYYWICRSVFYLIPSHQGDLYDVLLSFFAAHHMASVCFSYFITRNPQKFDAHPLCARYDVIMKLYNDIYNRYDDVMVDKADTEANRILSSTNSYFSQW